MYRTIHYTIALLEHNIVEVIFNPSVVVTTTILQQLEHDLEHEFAAPIYMILDNQYPYSFDFDAQLKLTDINFIKAIAMVTYSELSLVSAQMLEKMPRQRNILMNVFHCNLKALHWLNTLQKGLPNNSTNKYMADEYISFS